MAAKKKVPVPKVVTSRVDPEVRVEAFVEKTGTEVVAVDESMPQPPAIVSALAAKKGLTPWTWFVGQDHVTIVMTNGQKFRFERE